MTSKEALDNVVFATPEEYDTIAKDLEVLEIIKNHIHCQENPCNNSLNLYIECNGIITRVELQRIDRPTGILNPIRKSYVDPIMGYENTQDTKDIEKVKEWLSNE